VSHGSVLNENYAPTRVTSGWKSTGFGLDVPGVALGEDWMLVVMNAIGLGTLRHGIQKSGL
jgi:hypothetical protein